MEEGDEGYNRLPPRSDPAPGSTSPFTSTHSLLILVVDFTASSNDKRGEKYLEDSDSGSESESSDSAYSSQHSDGSGSVSDNSSESDSSDGDSDSESDLESISEESDEEVEESDSESDNIVSSLRSRTRTRRNTRSSVFNTQTEIKSEPDMDSENRRPDHGPRVLTRHALKEKLQTRNPNYRMDMICSPLSLLL